MIKIALLGFGTVGQGVYRILNEQRDEIRKLIGEDLVIEKILVKNLNKKRSIDLPSGILTDDYNDILENEEISLIVEVTSDKEEGYEYIRSALESRKNVVTASKAVVSAHFEELTKLVEKKELYFLYEASVGGGIPIIKAVKDQLRLNRINKVSGILNGTCNYILTSMEQEGLSYEEGLLKAQEEGYAEADPASDVEGTDTLRKLRILSTLSFRAEIKEEDIECRGITSISKLDLQLLRKKGRKVKLIGDAFLDNEGYTAIVEPVAIREENSLYNVNYADNAVLIESSYTGPLLFKGPGAGLFPTANAVVTDILDCLAGTQVKEEFMERTHLNNKNGEVSGSYYVRMNAIHYDKSMNKDWIQEVLYEDQTWVALITKSLKKKDLILSLSNKEDKVYVLIKVE